jgi:hypothetical protein
MPSFKTGKSIIVHLNSIWREIIASEKPSNEIIYRLEKLIRRLDTLADKIFIKTVKGHDILLKCLRLTEQFQLNINAQREADFLLLTCIEACVDGLVRKTHDFRIKAG